MGQSRRQTPRHKFTYEAARDLLEGALEGPTRGEIIDHALASGSFTEALKRLRNSIQNHTFETPSGRLLLGGIVQKLDARTQAEGFHVLLEWDGKRFVDETIPVMMVDYFARANKAVRPDRRCLAILLDYYFLYVIALFLMRIWDEGDPNANLDHVTRLLVHLQGPQGSGLQMVEDAATLLWIAISHYEPDDFAYHRLLDRVRTLDDVHQTGIALQGAPVLGDHLRWGFPVYYERDLGLMRADNVSDYPWLFYSVLTLMRAYARMCESGAHGPERDRIVEAALNGLTPDTRAFTESPPATLARFRKEHEELRGILMRHRDELIRDFERFRPASDRYSPLGFQFNFPHNALLPMVTLALVQGVDRRLNMPLNALLRGETAEGGSSEVGASTSAPAEATAPSPEMLARTLMAYAGYSPEKRNGRRTLMIIYDPNAALSSFNRTLTVLKEPRPEVRPSANSAMSTG
jgi:hypothetical protein